MQRVLTALVVLLVGSTITCTPGWAQATAQITGNIRDASGAVLPGVELKATQTETGITRTTRSRWRMWRGPWAYRCTTRCATITTR